MVTTMYSIDLRHLAKSFGQKDVLKDISLAVHAGEIFGLLGPSGAGKTTLNKILTGQLTYKGFAEILGKHCNQLDRTIYADLGVVLDNCGIYERLSCYDNLKLFARLHGINHENIMIVLNRVGLTDIKMPAGKLSKGMRQRLILARALLHRPKLLVLDEPTNGLDPSTAYEIRKFLLEVNQVGTTVLLTTHYMEEAFKLCSHIALLNEGHIVEYGVPEEICRKYNRKNIVTILRKDGSLATYQNGPESAEMIAACFSKDNVEAIHSSEPNLETVFMSLTGKELNL